ncbi:MAG TPA: YihY/virulence factor BrkB family protein [Stellaceae bacterium]|nr:YihY/virulence factor BrkB family protein [Stellaceae bacterium]
MRSVFGAARECWLVLRAAAVGWLNDRAATMGAAIAYYAVFSLGPLLILVIAVAGLVYGKQAAEGALFEEIATLVGEESAGAVQALLRNASSTRSGIVATIIGIAFLVLAATGVFEELQGAFNVIWKAERPKVSGVLSLLLMRLRSLCFILVIGLLLTASLALTAGLALSEDYLRKHLPSLTALLDSVDVPTSLAMPTLLFALMFRILPDTRVEWRDVWLGAITSAVLFEIGKYLIGLYIGGGGVMSTYRAAGALVLLLVWIYYSAQILLFGAEIAKASGERRKARRRRQ